MPPSPSRPRQLRRRVFLGRDAVDCRLLTRQQLRSRAWRRLRRGVYADADLPVDHGLMAHAAGLVLPESAAITGRSAAWLWGARIADAHDPVDVIVSPAHRWGPVDGLRIRITELADSEVALPGGIRVTLPSRTAWEVAVRDPLEDAVVVLDALAALDRMGPAELASYLATKRGRRGWRTALRAFTLVDSRAESPQESRLRLRLVLAGLPAPVPQYQVRAAGNLIARVDLAWPEAKVAVEYDGAWHADRGQLGPDRRRLNGLLGQGWLVHHVTAHDMHDMHDISPTVTAVGRLLSSRGHPLTPPATRPR